MGAAVRGSPPSLRRAAEGTRDVDLLSESDFGRHGTRIPRDRRRRAKGGKRRFGRYMSALNAVKTPCRNHARTVQNTGGA